MEGERRERSYVAGVETSGEAALLGFWCHCHWGIGGLWMGWGYLMVMDISAT